MRFMNYKLFNSDYLKHLCQKHGLRPSKKYGQNYLIEPEVIEEILTAGDLSSDDTVVEVGPGFGILTFALAEKVKKVIAFEIEKKLQLYWEDRISNLESRNIEIVWGNILNEYSKFQLPDSKFKVIANIPYQITSQIIRLFLTEIINPPTEMILMVQKEVAERICAEAGEMSLLALSVQLYADPEIIAIIPRKSFWPEPAVDSAIIKITKHEPLIKNPVDVENFFKIARSGFAQKRKFLIKNLEPVIGKKNKAVLQQIFAEIGLLPTVRAQELSLDNWIALVHLLSSHKV